MKGNISPAVLPDRAPIRSASIEFHGETEHELILQAIAWLRNLGYIVQDKAQKWETPQQFCRRHDICSQTLIRKLASHNSPGCTVDRANGGSGRLLRLASNPQFDEFCIAGKQ